MHSTMLTIDQLCVSPLNVRKNRKDANATSTLEASILRVGLLEPLLVHTVEAGKHGAFIGQRRLNAIRKIIERGERPSDWAIPVQIRDDLSEAEIIGMSTAENVQRRDLRDYELYAAVRAEHEAGHSPRQIADTLGQELDWVEKALRLGNLAPCIFDALAQGEIGNAEARAYGATADHALQLEAFTDLHRLDPHHRTPDKIRAFLNVGNLELERLLRFVGPSQYQLAGGRLEPDLFSDGIERAIIHDAPLLRGLVDTRLRLVREQIRSRAGRDLRFQPEPPQNGFGADRALLIDAEPDALPDGDVVATIDIDEDGVPEILFWWASRKAKNAADRSPAPRLTATADTALPRAAAGVPARDTSAPALADPAPRQIAGMQPPFTAFQSEIEPGRWYVGNESVAYFATEIGASGQRQAEFVAGLLNAAVNQRGVPR